MRPLFRLGRRSGLRLAALLLAGLILSVRWWGRLFFPLPYFDLVSAHARRHSLDPLLVEALIREESFFDPHAVSKRGALGLMQIMPETGLWIASQFGEELTPAELLSPKENIRYGVWYLATLFARFAGDATKALAAYNAGYNRVERWLASGIWDGTPADLGRLPFFETRSYVMKIMRSYRIYRFLYGRVSPRRVSIVVFPRRPRAAGRLTRIEVVMYHQSRAAAAMRKGIRDQ